MALSYSLLRAMNGGETDEVLVLLVTVYDPDSGSLLRFSSDNAERFSDEPLAYGTTSRGDAFNFLPMKVTFPSSGDDTAPAMSVTLDAVAQEAVPLLRSIRSMASVTIELVLASSPDTVEMAFPAFDLTQFDLSAGSCTVSLSLDSLESEPFPGPTFNPQAFPGLF